MKHLFYVHSHTTKLITQSIIQAEKLNKNDVIVLLNRGIQGIDNHICFDFPFCHYPVESFPSYLKFWKGRNKLNSLNSFLNSKLMGDEYLFYAPHLGLKMFQLIVTSSKCKGYCFIEEGKLSFNRLVKKEIKKEIFDKFIDVLNYGNRIFWEQTYYTNNYKVAYRFSHAAFPNSPRVENIQLQLTNNKISKIIEKKVLILDPIVEAAVIKIEDYLISILRLIILLKKQNESQIYFKFHPDQQIEISKKSIIDLFDSIECMKFIEISNEDSLEEIAYSYNSKCKFYSMVSSSLFYLRYFGSETFSFLNLCPNREAINRYLEKQPSPFVEILQFV